MSTVSPSTSSASDRPLVSVVIPCHNRAHTLPATLASVAAQTWRPLEIVAIDDGSADDTLAVLRSFASRTDIAVQIHSRENRGVTATRNEGLDRSSGAFIAFVDSDDLWLPQKIEQQMALMASRPEVGLCHTGVEMIDARGRSMKRYLDPVPAYRGRWLIGQIQGNCIQTSSVLMRREVCRSVGHFDESLRACEDWDYWLRVARACDIDFVPARLTRMRQHAVRLSRDVELMRASHLAVLDKLQRGPLMGDEALRAAILARRRDVHFDYGRSRIMWLLDMKGGREDLWRAGWLPGRGAATLGLWLRSLLPMRELRALRQTLRTARQAPAAPVSTGFNLTANAALESALPTRW